MGTARAKGFGVRNKRRPQSVFLFSCHVLSQYRSDIVLPPPVQGRRHKFFDDDLAPLIAGQPLFDATFNLLMG